MTKYCCLTQLQRELGLKCGINFKHGFSLQARVGERLWRMLSDLDHESNRCPVARAMSAMHARLGDRLALERPRSRERLGGDNHADLGALC